MRVIRTKRKTETAPILKLCERMEENLVVWDAECSVQYPIKRENCAVDVQYSYRDKTIPSLVES